MTLFQPVLSRWRALKYGNPFYRLLLEHKLAVDGLRLSLADVWPGDAEAGQKLLRSPARLFGREAPDNAARSRAVLSHRWLRDLRAVGTAAARRKARELVQEWIARHDFWREDSWAPGVLGERLANWVLFYGFFAGEADHVFSDQVLASLSRQGRHLARTLPGDLTGPDNLCAVKGLLAAGFGLGEGEKAATPAFAALKRQLFAEILSDGGHVSRNPLMQSEILRHLIDVRTILTAAKREIPHELVTAIERMVPALKLFRHGDGALALFNGSRESTPLELDAILTQAGTRGRVLRRLPQTGYERIASGRSLLLVDTGTPPPAPFDAAAHAGLLSFELSSGRERLIVNCGAGPEDDAEWRMALAATAAHSTLTLNDTNACEILEHGGIGHRPKKMAVQRYEQNGAHYIEASHDGYEKKFHAVHHRSLCLARDGEELHGRDVLSGPPGRAFVLRWHLHPSVQASLSQGGLAALLRLPSGTGWRLRVLEGSQDGELSLEPGVYGGSPSPRRSLQLKFSGRSREDPAIINWLLTREKKV